MNNKNYIKVYYDILQNEDLTLFEKIIYSILDSYCSTYDVCFISNARLAEETNTCNETIKRTLKTLRSKKYISTWRFRNGNGKKLYRAITTNKNIFTNQEKLKELKNDICKKKLFDYDWLNERDWYYERNKNL